MNIYRTPACRRSRGVVVFCGARRQISESTRSCCPQQHRAVRSEALRGVGVLVEEIEEQLLLLRQSWTTFTKSRQREWPTDIETILVLQQLRLRQATGVVEKRVSIELVVAIEIVSLAVIARAAAWRGELHL